MASHRSPLWIAAMLTATLWTGCVTGPIEGAIRYRGKRAQVLVVRTLEQQPVLSKKRPKFGRLGRKTNGVSLREAVSVLSPDELGRLVDNLDTIGFFALSHREEKAPAPLPMLTIAVAVQDQPPRLVRLAELKTHAQAVVFSEAAMTILRAAGRR